MDAIFKHLNSLYSHQQENIEEFFKLKQKILDLETRIEEQALQNKSLQDQIDELKLKQP